MKKQPSLWILALTVFFDLLGFGIIIPILPYFAEHFGASGIQIGLLMGIYSLMQFLFAPVWGNISDRMGRVPVLIISTLGHTMSYLIMAFTNSLVGLFAARIVAGILGANISTAYAYAADVTTTENRTKAMGLLGAALGLGFTIGPAIGGVLASNGFQVPLFFAFGLGTINSLLLYLWVKEPNNKAKRASRFDWAQLKTILSNVNTGLPIFIFFLFTIATNQLEFTFPLFMKHVHHWSVTETGLAMGAMGMIMVIFQSSLTARFSKKWGENKLVISALLVASLLHLGLGFTSYLWVTFLLLIGVAAVRGILHPCLSSLTSQSASPDHMGLTMGAFQSAASLARIFGPLSAGLIYDTGNHGWPYVFAGILLGLGYLIWIILSPTTRQ